MLRIYGSAFYKNIKIYLVFNILCVCVLLIALGFATDLRNCDARFAYSICQRFFSASGIIMLTTIFAPEQKENIGETIFSKVVPNRIIYLMRFIMGGLSLCGIALIFFRLLIFMGGSFDFGKYYAHSLATTFFLGSLGMAGSRLSGNVYVGYLLAFGFYIFEFFATGFLADYFHIFTLRSNDNSIYPVLVGAVVFFIISFVKKCDIA